MVTLEHTWLYELEEGDDTATYATLFAPRHRYRLTLEGVPTVSGFVPWYRISGDGPETTITALDADASAQVFISGNAIYINASGTSALVPGTYNATVDWSGATETGSVDISWGILDWTIAQTVLRPGNTTFTTTILGSAEQVAKYTGLYTPTNMSRYILTASAYAPGTSSFTMVGQGSYTLTVALGDASGSDVPADHYLGAGYTDQVFRAVTSSPGSTAYLGTVRGRKIGRTRAKRTFE